MHCRARALPSQYVGPRRGRVGKACLARGMGYRLRYVAWGILRAAVACSSRYPANWGEGGIRRAISAGFVARDRPGGKANKRGIFLAQNLLFVHLCASKSTRVFA